ncbi:MAG: PAS domain S-box protein, partial [SAR324 cluster bacterium]|nr:PAS domain S-box protein [SAR324 cluster bacterium]
MKLKLRLLLPLLVAGFSMLVISLSYFVNRSGSLIKVEEEKIYEAQNRLNSLQGTIEYFQQAKSVRGIQKTISSMAPEADILNLFITDSSGNIIATIHFSQQARHWSELQLGLSEAVIKQVIKTQVSWVTVNPEKTKIQAYYSICGEASTISLRPNRDCGFLFYESDLAYHKEITNEILISQALDSSLGILLMGLIFWLTIYFLLTRRVNLLLAALRAFTNGDKTSRPIVTRNDEISSISRGINILIDTITEDENALREREGQLKSIFDSSSYSIISVDPHGIVTSFNPVAEKLLGYSADEVVGKLNPALFHDPEEVVAQAKKLTKEFGHKVSSSFEVFVAKASKGILDENEWSYIHKSGKRTLVKVRVNAIFDIEKNILGYVGIGEDLTEKKQSLTALRLADMVFQNTGEAIVVTDLDSNIIDINPAYTKITGYLRDEIIGKTPAIAKSGKHPPEFYQQMWESILNRGSWTGEIWDRRKNGEPFPKVLTINAVADETGQTSHYVGTFKD